MRSQILIAAGLVCAVAFTTTVSRAADPLPSWNDGPAKNAIVEFVTKVTTAGSPDFVPVAERIATFDNDGTLWAEQPLYFQFLFAMDRVKALAPLHPEWKDKEPLASLLKDDTKGALAGAAIGAKKSARFLQIENQLNTSIDLRIAAALPLMK